MSFLFVLLEKKNYSTWAFQFKIFVTGKELSGHVDGTNPTLLLTKQSTRKHMPNGSQKMHML
jgi:hypothetical protein